MENNYIITSDGFFIESTELMHYGIKGQKWGVRRYQNKDGSLTAAGKKRYDSLTSAADKAKRFSDMARKDSERFNKKAEEVKLAQISDSQYKKAMRELFGNYANDAKYVETEAKNMGYNKPRQMAKEHLGIGKEGYEVYKAFANRAKKAADFYKGLSDSYKNADISSLNKKQIKKAEKFVKNGYLENMTYREYNLEWDKQHYGL